MNANVTPRFNPFPGLRPFGIEEDYLFFGREEQATELLGLLREHRFLAVVGTSGSGKSSLVRAGVLPALYGMRTVVRSQAPSFRFGKPYRTSPLRRA